MILEMDTQQLFNMSNVMLPLILFEPQTDTLQKMRELSKTPNYDALIWIFLVSQTQTWLQTYKHTNSYVLHTVGAIEAR